MYEQSNTTPVTRANTFQERKKKKQQQQLAMPVPTQEKTFWALWRSMKTFFWAFWRSMLPGRKYFLGGGDNLQGAAAAGEIEHGIGDGGGGNYKRVKLFLSRLIFKK